MKRLIYSIIILISCLSSCNSYKDIDTAGESDTGAVSMNVDILVSGNMVSTRSTTSSAENTVKQFDIFVFSVTSNGTFLETMEQNVTPDLSEKIASTGDIKIAAKTMNLTSNGTKRIIVVGNSQLVSYPSFKTMSESSSNKYTDVTTYEDMQKSLTFSVSGSTVPSSPFVMLGNTIVASANGTNAFVKLARQYSKLDIDNNAVSSATSGLYVQSVQLTNVAQSSYPLINNFTTQAPSFTNYDAIAIGDPTSTELLKDKAYVLYSPGTNITADYRMGVVVKGLLDGANFEQTFYCPNPLYPDYDYIMTLYKNGSKVTASFEPNWSEGVFTLSGQNLSNGGMTFSWMKEANWGYELTWTTNMTGSVTVKKSGTESWYTAKVVDDKIRVCCVEDNTSSSVRSAEFTAAIGKKSVTVTVIQQGKELNTIDFNGMKWLDRNLGATLPATAANITNSATYGFYYQWGRNVPFPTYGTVDTVDPDASRSATAANSISQFISFAGDWLTDGSVVTDKKTTWKDRCGSEPCPEGYHVPSYMEYQTILPYTNATGVGNFSTVKTVLKTGEILDKSGTSYSTLYVTAGPDKAAIYGIKKYGTADAYVLRWQRIQQDGVTYLRIDRLPGTTTTDFAGSDAAAKLASAESMFASASATDMQTIYFPGAGRRDRVTGKPTDQGNVAAVWSATVWTGANSSSLWFDAVGTNTRIYNMANSRAHGQNIRCIKDY
jgi:uncharacterized protein (TIGR02145 family)